MKIINEPDRKKYYIDKYLLDKILPDEVMSYVELIVINQGEHILTANSEMSHFYFLVKGRLKLYQVHENGRALLIQFYSKFDSLGEVEFMTGVLGTCSVAAVKETELLRIPFDVLRAEAENHPPFLKYIVKSLSSKLVKSERHHSYNLIHPVKLRLASYLKAHLNEQNEIYLNNTLQEVSEFIGTTYRQLHRAFTALEKEEIIIRKGKAIHVKKIDALQRLAGHIYETL